MVFSSTIFLFLFLPLTILGYYLINPKFRNTFLLFVSIIFYAWGEPKFVFIMLFSIFTNYLFGLLVDKFRNKKKVAKIILLFFVLFNVSIFYVYKYLNFTIININRIIDIDLPLTDIVLPIGISFFTFQAMSYVLDVYYQKGKVQKNPLNVALYIMLFPQLIAGPIVRYETVSNQINHRNENFEVFAEGIKRFIIGLAKKVLISNSVAIIADKSFAYTDFTELSVTLAWLGAIAYALQIYFDFSGYSDMAIGLGRMFGFYFDENFNYPYISKTITEFWRRWHISLGTWFRDYVYFPMGGSRVNNKSHLIFNLFVVWTLTGIWHGASWNFVVWGLLYFIILTFEKLTGIPKKVENNNLLKHFYRVFTLLFVLVGWVIFRAYNLSHAIDYLKSMLGLSNNNIIDGQFIYLISSNYLIILIALLFCMPIAKKVKEVCNIYFVLNRMAFIISPIMYMVLFIVNITYTVTSTYNPFIYFNF